MDGYLQQNATQGLEAFSSAETIAAVTQVLGDSATPAFLANMPALLKSNRFDFQWLGLPIDQCSVGMSGSLAAKRLFRLFVEGIFDPAHLKLGNSNTYSIF